MRRRHDNILPGGRSHLRSGVRAQGGSSPSAAVTTSKPSAFSPRPSAARTPASSSTISTRDIAPTLPTEPPTQLSQRSDDLRALSKPTHLSTIGPMRVGAAVSRHAGNGETARSRHGLRPRRRLASPSPVETSPSRRRERDFRVARMRGRIQAARVSWPRGTDKVRAQGGSSAAVTGIGRFARGQVPSLRDAPSRCPSAHARVRRSRKVIRRGASVDQGGANRSYQCPVRWVRPIAQR